MFRDTWIPLTQSLWNSLKVAFGNNHDFISLKKRHPKIFSFIHSRLDVAHFSGLTMTLFVLLFFYIATLFGGVVEDLITKDTIVKIDHRIAAWSNTIRTDFFNDFFWAITQLGSLKVIAFLVAFFTLFLWFGHRCYNLIGLYVIPNPI